jgi:hypothetical protein
VVPTGVNLNFLVGVGGTMSSSSMYAYKHIFIFKFDLAFNFFVNVGHETET